jgi:hypothetical protein
MHFLIIWVSVFVVVLVFNIYNLGRRMNQPEKMIKPIEGGLSQFEQQSLANYSEWMAANGMEYCASFLFGKIRAVVFQQKGRPRFVTFMFHQRLTYSIESYLEDLTILDTSTSGSVGLFPRPGAYAQSFPGIALPEAWDRHVQGEEYLAAKLGFAFVPLSRPYLQILEDAIRLRMNYNRSQLFWPFRVLFRFFVTRHLLKNKTIAQQFP